MNMKNFIIRAETKPNETRTPVVPEDARKLLLAGNNVFIETSKHRCIADNEYEAVGCEIVPAGSWLVANAKNSYVIGLKELPELPSVIRQNHVYFGHAYKQQIGWQKLLNRFTAGEGSLFDIEYMTQNNRRVAAFGHWAGYVGACLAIQNYCWQLLGQELNNLDESNYRRESLIAYTELLLQKSKVGINQLKILVLGVLGRSGQGAAQALADLGLASVGLDIHDSLEGINLAGEFDVMINCVFIDKPTQPFIQKSDLFSSSNRVRTIVDVSCDPTSTFNPLPIYQTITTLEKPAIIFKNNLNTNLIAIDHLPTLLPLESSIDFSAQLTPYLLELVNCTAVWQETYRKFLEMSANATSAASVNRELG